MTKRRAKGVAQPSKHETPGSSPGRRSIFYVYDLVDPRDGSTFYVGKGQGARKSQHAIDARRGAQSRKCDRIRAIHAAGHEVVEREIASFSDEGDAYVFEAERIESFGLMNLTNVVRGGGRISRCRRRVTCWPADALRGIAAVLRVPNGTPMFWGGYDITFSHATARQALASLVREWGFNRASRALAPYGVELVEAA